MKILKLKNRKKVNFKILYYLFAMIFVMSVGFAYVQSSLSITGVANIEDGAWNIYFDNISKVHNMMSDTTPTINTMKDTINFNLTLETKLDYYEFEVDVVNDGEYDAMVSTINFDPIPDALKDYINYTLHYSDGREVLNNDALRSGARKRLKVRYSFKEGFKETNIPLSTYTITFKIPYVQATADAVDR